MSLIENVQSAVQVGDHFRFVEDCDVAIVNWETNRDLRLDKYLRARLEKRAAWIEKYNKKILVRLGIKKSIAIEYSLNHYYNAMWKIYQEQMIPDYSSFFERSLNFKNDEDEPTWWLENDFYTIYNMYSKSTKGIKWIDKVREMRKVANHTNAAQLFVDSELYEYIMNLSKA